MDTDHIPTDTNQDGSARSMGTASVVLGITGLLPVLPLVGSIGAIVCGLLAEHERDRRGRIGIALGVLGVLAPLGFLFVYCVVLGYPFPIHRYRPQ